MDYTNLAAFLVWVGSPVVLGGFLSWLFKRWAWYQGQDFDVKRAVAVVLSFVLGGGLNWLIRSIPADFITQAQPVFADGMLLVLAVLANQGAFALTRKSEPLEFEADFSNKI